MTARQFYDWQTAGGGGDVSLLVETLERREIPWCMIGGLAVNHWAKEPLATADVNVVIAAGRISEAVKALRAAGFTANTASPTSDRGTAGWLWSSRQMPLQSFGSLLTLAGAVWHTGRDGTD